MNPELQPGLHLLERFELIRPLHRGSSAQLWSARDLHLDAPILLRVYPEATPLIREIARRDASRFRGLRHPGVARVHDVHEGEGALLVSIEPHEGELLSGASEPAAPMPYGRLLEMIRPLVEALVELHENGFEHGRLDTRHVLQRAADARWVLLPGDATAPDVADLAQLARLKAELLTGGAPPPEGRSLNDLPDRLHAGRTVPALLDQLIADLQASEAALRPASMRDVLDRLDQIERFIAPPAPDTDATPPTPSPFTKPIAKPIAPPGAAEPARPRRRPALAYLAWLLVPAVLVAGVLLLQRADRNPAVDPALPPSGPPPAATPTTPTPATPPTTPADPTTGDDGATPADDARLAAERNRAEAALERSLAARREADAIGAAEWGGEPYGAAAATAAEADGHFLEQRYVEATEGFDDAAEAFERVIDAKDEALVQLLLDGAAALELPDAEAATHAFDNALAIEPGNDEATIGLRRAGTLDELHELLASGRAHEDAGRIAFAYADYTEATALDPHSEEAATAHARIEAALADDAFLAIMSRGLEAYHRGDYDAAQTALTEAQELRPGAPEVTDALSMVEEARLRRRVERLRDDARAHEETEQWQAAWNVHRQVLAIDATIAFAQEGKARCEEMIGLTERVAHYLANPDLLLRRGTREDAQALVRELESAPSRGPRFQEIYAELAEQVRLANTPQRVTLRSDEKTEVAVYRVGRYGVFRSKELELLPGEYTVVGRRAGYKDVRLTLRVRPGGNETTLEVVCTDSI